MVGVRPLPLTIPTHDLAIHDNEKSCYVTIGANVYDVTSFLSDHPGGGDLILEYGGKDVSEIMGDGLSHVHSETAYQILNDHLIGFIANEATINSVVEHHSPNDCVPMSPAGREVAALKAYDIAAPDQRKPVSMADNLHGVNGLTEETDSNTDFATHKFLNLDKPLFPQMWNGGFSKKFYLEQVHRPRYYTKGESAPLFGNFLEPLSLTPWYIVPLIWLPLALYGTFLANQGMPSVTRTVQYLLIGLFLFPLLVEYWVHRAAHHMDRFLPDNRIGITIHFLLHGIHHYLPMDRYRVTTPPIVSAFPVTAYFYLVHLVFYWDWHVATAVFSGGLFGYVSFEILHYHLHHSTFPSYFQNLKKYHLEHHYSDSKNGFGVTTRFWDQIFGTELSFPRTRKKRQGDARVSNLLMHSEIN